MPPRGKRGLSKGRDDYAAQRCLCGHLMYPGLGEPGGVCPVNLFSAVGCPCANHVPKGGS